ncbi:Rv2732c family membrane protein [Nocardia sp. NPDC003345]
MTTPAGHGADREHGPGPGEGTGAEAAGSSADPGVPGGAGSAGDPGGAGESGAEETADGNEDDVKPAEATEKFEEFRDDLDAVERRIAGEIDPGVRAMVVAGAVFVLLLSLVLPHAGGARGFDVLLGSEAAAAEHIGLPSRIFVWFVALFGIVFSLLALMTRRWVLAWIAVAGSAIGSAFGVFSIWHRQTPGLNNYVGAGPGIGLILGTLAIMVLTFHWVKVVWSRTAVQLAAEEQRRIAAAEEEQRQRRHRLGED